MSTIIGIDPGFERCGYAVLNKSKLGIKLLSFGVIKTSPQDDFIRRQAEIAADFQTLLDKYKPDVLAIEDLFFVQNVTTGLKVAQVRGVLTHLAHNSGIKILEPKPTEIKKFFTGNGGADKKAMQQMAVQTFGLTQSPKLDDTADALAIAYLGSHQALPLRPFI